MISDLDETIKQLLIKEGKLDPAEVDIVFEMPDREWSGKVTKPTVNIYLYDIHENLDLRNNEWKVVHNNGVATKTKAPIRVDLSYLVTVWTNDTADQHRLLSHILATLFRHREIPDELLHGSLANTGYPIRTHTAQPDGVLRNSADFWGALDNQLKPSISYVVTIPVDLDVAVTAPEVKTKVLAFHDMEGAISEELVQIDGKVHRKGKPDEVIADAIILAKELQMTATTDEAGKYLFRKMRFGSHTFEVQAPGEEKKQVPVTVPSASYDIEL
ncbi:MAG: DUF4255 domain-containing protein [Dehalococcoidia bacterium]|nr:DUF4255 domain-containing protein [Dehalococcoidia bacterium]